MNSTPDLEWGFDVHNTAPFLAFRALRDRAIVHVGESRVFDLSQGEPGYGFAPNVRSRQFYSFLLFLDIEFNNNKTGSHFAELTRNDLPEILARIEKTAKANYSKEKATELLEDFQIFLSGLRKICKEQDLGFGDFEILYDIFKYAVPSGGRYPNPWGAEPIVRAAMANEYRHVLGLPVETNDLILISGASHGIGTVFKALGEDGIGFLKSGDWAVMTSPVYAPYNNIMEDRGINVFSLSIDPETGKVDEKSLEDLMSFKEKIKSMILINPNNPTGFPFDEKLLTSLAEIAEKHDSLIITDEVYLQFFDSAKSILSVGSTRKRTIHISSISKTERATGVRFGSFLILPEAKKYITEKILGPGLLGKYKSIDWLLYMAKSPGGKTLGAFQHITGIPGPSQILGLCHLVLGKEERVQYFLDLKKKMEIFYSALAIEYRGNLYYGIFDMEKLSSPSKMKLPPERKFAEIADLGVVLMPANLFFSEDDRKTRDYSSFVRVSLPNLSFENTKKAAEIIGAYLRGDDHSHS